MWGGPCLSAYRVGRERPNQKRHCRGGGGRPLPVSGEKMLEGHNLKERIQVRLANGLAAF